MRFLKVLLSLLIVFFCTFSYAAPTTQPAPEQQAKPNLKIPHHLKSLPAKYQLPATHMLHDLRQKILELPIPGINELEAQDKYYNEIADIITKYSKSSLPFIKVIDMVFGRNKVTGHTALSIVLTLDPIMTDGQYFMRMFWNLDKVKARAKDLEI